MISGVKNYNHRIRQPNEIYPQLFDVKKATTADDTGDVGRQALKRKYSMRMKVSTIQKDWVREVKFALEEALSIQESSIDQPTDINGVIEKQQA